MKRIATVIATSAVVCLICMSCSEGRKPAALAENQEMSTEDFVKRGEYLVNTIGCHDCHSPKKMGPQGLEIIPELMLSGYQQSNPVIKADVSTINPGWGMFNEDLTTFVGPWGQSFSANLTPDATGLGNWTEEQFRTALTRGWFKGIENSRMLLPPMPWFNYINMKEEDLHAIFLYLKSIPPVQNVVPAAIPPANS